jgi:hypothetical protein
MVRSSRSAASCPRSRRSCLASEAPRPTSSRRAHPRRLAVGGGPPGTRCRPARGRPVRRCAVLRRQDPRGLAWRTPPLRHEARPHRLHRAAPRRPAPVARLPSPTRSTPSPSAPASTARPPMTPVRRPLATRSSPSPMPARWIAGPTRSPRPPPVPRGSGPWPGRPTSRAASMTRWPSASSRPVATPRTTCAPSASGSPASPPGARRLPSEPGRRQA